MVINEHVWQQRCLFLHVQVIIGREIAMSALRELAASLGGDAYKAVAVSPWGKWKTATQAGPPPVHAGVMVVLHWLLGRLTCVFVGADGVAGAPALQRRWDRHRACA